ncbi:MAG: SIMPL domain-containing protein [Candidatus Eremiobacteraeota bacterium]|nr:SIMPL domain-containing protein [Candidatus Eremiobacteraeota bacterium]MBC5801743.1 SIMPL domain-containing protein [Candidatus Eremiobacteraeota bacterium]MBC5821509.1 SIMPL domain-containing protein [Candidatus Eremiobacteraeota bacterium]
MRSAFRAVALVLALGALAPVPAGAQNASQARQELREAGLIVDGNGTIERPPDEARVSVTILDNADVASQSAGNNTTTYNALLARLQKLGIARDAVRTTFYNVQFVPRPPGNVPPEGRQARYGYITTRNLSVTVTPLENVGEVIDAANAAGVDQVGDVSFDLRDRQSAYAAALVAAVNDARRTATTLAAAAGLHLVRIRTISTGSQAAPIRPVLFDVALRSAVAAAPAPPPTEIQPSGPISVAAQVRVIYDIR